MEPVYCYLGLPCNCTSGEISGTFNGKVPWQVLWVRQHKRVPFWGYRIAECEKVHLLLIIQSALGLNNTAITRLNNPQAEN